MKLKFPDVVRMVIVVVVVMIIDQATKIMVLNSFIRGEVLSIIPGFFNLTLHFNRGAAFGIMAGLPDGYRQLALGGSTIIALVCVVFFLLKHYSTDRLGQFAIALIMGGAFGNNLIDRPIRGEVVDFLDFYVYNYHWPAFNVADSCICIGVLILLFHQPKREIFAYKK